MRVIAGTARGTKLYTLPGDDIIRPTTDRVKESLFNIIQFSVKGSDVLDVFCGSGALGTEALSRGAASCCFVDSSSKSLKVAENNLKKTHLEANSKLIKSDFRDFFSSNRKKYDIIFADPPYAAGFLNDFISKPEICGALKDDGMLVFETSSETAAEGNLLLPYRTAHYGKTQIIFYKHRESL